MFSYSMLVSNKIFMETNLFWLLFFRVYRVILGEKNIGHLELIYVQIHCPNSKCLLYGQTFQMTLTMRLLKIPQRIELHGFAFTRALLEIPTFNIICAIDKCQWIA